MTEQIDEEPTSARDVLSYMLKSLREKAGKSLSQLAEDTGYERSYLNRLENGDRLSKRTVMEDLDGYYETDTLLRQLWKLAKDEVIVDRYRLFMQYEATATIMHRYSEVIPGLLQTEGYARVLFSSAPGRWTQDELESQISARIGRQYLLHRTPAPSARFIINESVLMRPTVDPEVWREQLSHLIKSADLPSIVLQVLPFSAGVHPLMGGSLALLWQQDGSSVAWMEGNNSGTLYEDSEEVTKFRLSYDRLRDLALTPSASVNFISKILEDSKP
ncbi:helix-turn-helix domain-containing protein [Streptomyces profundus]|uniref:helix-turn-helix domain-containing protein n=1 Tax=Streptomyces profundus TaxID=2867410 RepID=UPI001D16C888|nr:helix-turn-helix transcriptional regulator [Streptomyces sp. MA3_2.13]UED87179.1 helix-turn-helix domain-containing protein [Streptomyces sp. MA3_2.13]